jgi:hypothetical protein
VLSLLLTLIVIGLLYYVGFGLAVWLTRDGDDTQWTYTRMPFWGFGFSGISLLYLGQMGIPTRTGIWIVLALATGLNVSALRYRRASLGPDFFRSCVPLLIPSVVMLPIVAWPAAWVGLEYMSYFNEDMWRYSIVADWVSQHGYFDPPGARELATRFVHAEAVRPYFDAHYRVVVEYFLSGIVSLSQGHWQARQLFTPVILSFAFIAPNAALAFARDALRLSAARAWCIAALFALLSTYQWGVYYQLLAQSIGIPLMLLLVAEYAVYKSRRSWFSVCRLAGLTLLVALTYPEILPFAVLPIGADLVYSLASRALPRSPTITHMTALSVAVLMAGHVNTWYTWRFFLHQATYSVSLTGTYAFPYFYRASALPALYGLMPAMYNLMGTRTLSPIGYWCMVGGGLALLLVTLWGTWRLLQSKNVLAVSLLLVHSVAWLFFYVRRADFALFKESLFVSPLLVIIGAYGVLSGGDLRGFRNRRVPTPLIAGLALAWAAGNLWASLYTSLASFTGGEFGGKAAHAPRGLSEIHAIEQYLPAGSKVALATRLYSPLEWMSTLLTTMDQVLVVPPPWRFRGAVSDPPSSGDWHHGPVSADAVLTVGGKVQDLFQPFSPQGLLWSGELFSLYRSDRFYPWILPFSTRLGKLIAPKNVYGNPYPTGLYALERFEKRSVSWMGSTLSLAILASGRETVRLVMSHTNMLLKQPLSDLDIYLNHALLETVSTGGYGSRRSISRPFLARPDAPGAINAGRLDLVMRSAPTLIPSPIEPLLLGGEIPQDLRRATTLLVDLFLVRESDFLNRRVPILFTIQDGIDNRLLECGGFYDDGWVGPIFWTELSRERADTELVIRGQVPGNVGVAFPIVVTGAIDGSPIGRQTIRQAGDFELAFKPASPLKGRVVNARLEFSESFLLPKSDGRRAAGRLYSVGFR